MARDQIVFISDVHIGTATRTNWYQPRLHEAMLLAAFEWIVVESASIAELVILGDFVDQWTYAPDKRPPSFAEIAAANPAIFAPVEGALARALTALEGAVSWVTGNHDMSVTAADLASIRDAAGRTPRLVSAFPYLPTLGAGRIACAHGHQFSLLNAPDRHAMPASAIPLGHVITRLGAQWSLEQLTGTQTVADLPGAAEPSGWAFEKEELATLAVDVFENKCSIADMTIDALLRATGKPDTFPISMADGSVLTPAQAKAAYAGLYERFGNAADFPGAAYGLKPAFFALFDADVRNTLGHFARELGKRHRVIVMGHTHCSDDETQRPLIFGADNVYANSGFACPAEPDFMRAQHPRRPTFVVVRVDDTAKRFTVDVRVIERSGDKMLVSTEPLHTVTSPY